MNSTRWLADRAILLLIFLFACSKEEDHPTAVEPHQSAFEWARQAGMGGGKSLTGLCVDGMGYSVVVGGFGSEAVFDTIVLRAPVYELYAAKYDPSGKVLWAKNSVSSANCYAVALDIQASPGGTTVLCGVFSSSMSFGGIGVTSSSSSSFFLYKLDPSGAAVWGRYPAGTGKSSASKLVTDPAGGTYFTGSFTGTVSLDGSTMTCEGGGAAFVAKLDPPGTLVWAHQSTGSGYAGGSAIGIDAAGNTYVTGIFRGPVSFGSYSLTADSQSCGFLLKFDSSGKLVWAVKTISPGTPVDLATDAAGNSYVVGVFPGSADLSGIAIVGSSDHAHFLAAYDSGGNVLWGKSLDGWESSPPHLAVGPAGGCFVTGSFYRSMSFGGTSFSSVEGDIFVCKCSITGQVIWAHHFGGRRAAAFSGGIAADQWDNCYVAGVFQFDIDLDGIQLTSRGGTEYFLAKLLAH